MPQRPRQRFLLVRNPSAGLAGRSRVEQLVSALRDAGASVDLQETRTPEDAARLLGNREDIDAVLAAGGDGTIRVVAAALGERRLPVGIVPVGTGNVMAAEIGLPRRPWELARVLIHGPCIDIEGAQANSAPMFLMAGVGFDGEVVKRLAGPLKQRIGKAAYVPAALQALCLQQPALEVVVDGVAHPASWVVVARSSSYGGAFKMAPGASLARPGLVAVLFRSANVAERLLQLIALGIGQHGRLPSVEMIPCRHVSVRSAHTVAVEIDGDVAGTTPLDVVYGGPRLSLIVPEAYRSAAGIT